MTGSDRQDSMLKLRGEVGHVNYQESVPLKFLLE